MTDRWIIFDVDGTLIDFEDQPRWDVIDLLRNFHRLGFVIGVWSGGGEDYARMWVRRLGLSPFVHGVWAKDRGVPFPVALVVDDESIDVGAHCLNIKERK